MAALAKINLELLETATSVALEQLCSTELGDRTLLDNSGEFGLKFALELGKCARTQKNIKTDHESLLQRLTLVDVLYAVLFEAYRAESDVPERPVVKVNNDSKAEVHLDDSALYKALELFGWEDYSIVEQYFELRLDFKTQVAFELMFISDEKPSFEAVLDIVFNKQEDELKRKEELLEKATKRNVNSCAKLFPYNDFVTSMQEFSKEFCEFVNLADEEEEQSIVVGESDVLKDTGDDSFEFSTDKLPDAKGNDLALLVKSFGKKHLIRSMSKIRLKEECAKRVSDSLNVSRSLDFSESEDPSSALDYLPVSNDEDENVPAQKPNKRRRKKLAWSEEEIMLLESGMRKFGPSWSKILKEVGHGDGKSAFLSARSQVDLKDKARTEYRKRKRLGLPLGVFEELEIPQE